MSTLNEFGTTPGADFLKSLFSDIPADTRFSRTEYIQGTLKREITLIS